MSNHEKD